MEVIEAARKELLLEVEGLSDDSLNQRPNAENWSIKQILEHLYLYEEAATKAIQEEIQHGEKINVKEQPIHLSTNRKMKFEAADFSQPTDGFATLEELKEKLMNSRTQLLELLKETDEEVLTKKALPHPGFKMLNLKQWIDFIGWHERRHILQIKEVKDAVEAQ